MTIAAWVIIGIVIGVGTTFVMPVPFKRGKFAAALVGAVAAVVGGAMAAYFNGGPLLGFNVISVGIATSVAMYALFAYQCLEMRRRA